MRTSNELRQAFLDFFESKGHRVLPGISLVPTDPSLFLTGAGVVPFRAVIEGREPAPAPRVVTCQRSMRTTDIENVGKFVRYHTFFEMLGNFSFGDYYKAESLEWGFEFVTAVLGMDPDRIWGTIYPDDEEAFGIWTKQLGVPAERIIRLDDNFWGPVAETGACGPDSEIYYDLGPQYGCGKPDCRPGCDCDRYLEFWNHVFTELYKNPDGSFSPLPQRNIDTGMGLERLTCIVQGVPAVYETDLFAPFLDRLEELLRAGGAAATPREDWRKRVIADHSRAVCFLMMDGIYPGNVGRGYVLRRVLRRAATFGRLLGLREPFLHELVPVIVRNMAPGYPELTEKAGIILDGVRREESRFADALDRGMPRLLERVRQPGGGILDGAFAYHLKSTYGLPLELIEEVAGEYQTAVDEEGYRKAEEADRVKARGAQAHQKDLADDLGVPATEFVGYERHETDAEVLALFREGEAVPALQAGEEGALVLDRTPFYGESGGQLGDTGRLQGGAAVVDVVDTQRQGPVTVQLVRVEEGTVHPGMRLHAQVNSTRRAAIMRAHTATHLLHAALRQALGEHVVQRGSVVEPDRLRFDFAHPEAVTAEQLARVEQAMNEQVLADTALEIEQRPLAEARALGAMALFGEKYGEMVRVVRIPGFSIELCGGTHVPRTGTIGLVKVTSEGSVAAGVRRVDATCGMAALAYAQALVRRLAQAAQAAGGPPEQLIDRIQGLNDQTAALRRQLQEARQAAAGGLAESLAAQRQEVNGVPLIAASAEISDPEAVKTLVDTLAQRLGSGVVLLGAVTNGKSVFVTKVSPDWVERGVHAGNLVREVAQRAGGGGGGRPDFAQAGGRDPARVPEAVAAAAEILAGQVKRAG